MEIKFLSSDMTANEAGQIEGYGSIYESVDIGGDIVSRGAFSASLGRGRKIKMLAQHDPARVIGIWDEIKEDARGLRVKGRLLRSVSDGANAYELVKAGAIDGLSIGYRTLNAVKRDGTRVITEADLWEVSLVTFPMHEHARIDAVKAADMSERELERKLTRDAGFTRSVALALMGGGYNAVKAMRDAGDDDADELAALLKARLSL